MPSNDPRRPNVMFILTDDQGYWSLGCYGNAEARTPNLDRIAASGWRFDEFFCASPVCSPARASLLTGKIPSQHGVHDYLAAGDTTDVSLEPDGNGCVIEYLRDHVGYTDVLTKNGYACGLSGKWHLGDSHHAQKSFEFWEAHATGGGPYYQAPMIKDGRVHVEDGVYVTDLITDNTLRFLRDHKDGDNPFYLSVHYTAPHGPWGRSQHPKELFDDFHDNCSFESVPDGLRPPEWAEKLRIPVDSPEKRRNHLSGYFAAVAAMDANVGRLLNFLDENDLRENTLICFCGDNGMNMGHHGIFGKGNATFPMNMFEESVKVPFLMSHPARLEAGRTCSHLLSQYDFMPTLLDYLGLETPNRERLPGISFAGLLRGDDRECRARVVVYDEYGPTRMVRDREWKYVHRYPYGPHELYHLAEDPGETTNLIANSDCEKKLAQLRAALEEWFRLHVDPAMDGARQPVCGVGQLRQVGPLSEGKPSFRVDVV